MALEEEEEEDDDEEASEENEEIQTFSKPNSNPFPKFDSSFKSSFSSSKSIFKRVALLKKKLSPFDQNNDDPKEWLHNFEKALKKLVSPELFKTNAFAILNFFLDDFTGQWFRRNQREHKDDWSTFKEKFFDNFFTKYWENQQKIFAKHKPGEKYYDFFVKKIENYQKILPKVPTSCIFNLCLQHIPPKDVALFYPEKNEPIEIFLLRAKNVDFDREDFETGCSVNESSLNLASTNPTVAAISSLQVTKNLSADERPLL